MSHNLRTDNDRRLEQADRAARFQHEHPVRFRLETLLGVILLLAFGVLLVALII